MYTVHNTALYTSNAYLYAYLTFIYILYIATLGVCSQSGRGLGYGGLGIHTYAGPR